MDNTETKTEVFLSTTDDKNFEEKMRNDLAEYIRGLKVEKDKEINSIMEDIKIISTIRIRIPNVYTTLNNKIFVDLSRRFKQAGLSVYYKKLDGSDYVSDFSVGDALMNDLYDRAKKADNIFAKFKNEYKKKIDKDIGKITLLYLFNKFKYSIIQIMPFLRSHLPPTELFSDIDKAEMTGLIQDYIDEDSKIYDYSIEENIIPAIVMEITKPPEKSDKTTKHRYEAYEVPELLETCIAHDLEKLGLSHLLPDLKEALVNKYREDLSDVELSEINEKDMYLYVPDFTRKEKTQRAPSELVIKYARKKPDVCMGINITPKFGISFFAKVDLSTTDIQRDAAKVAIIKDLRIRVGAIEKVFQDKMDINEQRPDSENNSDLSEGQDLE